MANPGEIPADCWLLRWIPPDFMDVSEQGWAPKSQAFQDIEMDGVLAMSVYLECLLLDLGLDQMCVLKGLDGYGLVALRADTVIAEGFVIELSPRPEDIPRGQAHAHLVGDKSRKSVRRMLRDKSVVRHPL